MSHRLDQSELKALVSASARGDRRAFRRLYEACVARVHAQVGRLLGWSAATDDVTQDVFVAVFESLPSFKGDADFATWLYRVTRNVAISHLRHRGATTIDLASYRALAEVSQEPDLDARRQVGALFAALDDVPLEAREAFVAFELDGQPLTAIAAASDEPLHTIASRIRRTRERLREVLARAVRPLKTWRKAR